MGQAERLAHDGRFAEAAAELKSMRERGGHAVGPEWARARVFALMFLAREHRGPHAAFMPEGWASFAQEALALPGAPEMIVEQTIDQAQKSLQSRGAVMAIVHRDLKWLDLQLGAWEIMAPKIGGLGEKAHEPIAHKAIQETVGLWAPAVVAVKIRRAGVGANLSPREKKAVLEAWRTGLGPERAESSLHEHAEIAADSLRGLRAAGWVDEGDFAEEADQLLGRALRRAADTPLRDAAVLARPGCALWALLSQMPEGLADAERWESWGSLAQVAAEFSLRPEPEATRRQSGWARATALIAAKAESIEIAQALAEPSGKETAPEGQVLGAGTGAESTIAPNSPARSIRRV